ncbi:MULTISPECIES: hypothetical protein [Novosphingobium]|uniref:Uncharacterized protein n=1 Tax=Novosphingobium nitrogenifigens DSM 19370 TaxID=983920 RepID=F1Z4L4_9SPHN|nr:MULTISPECIES: hypothetical protein [Novosphingobium]EGD60453.1 hypothetical protein Y88_2930 [Novosphingobium nitrogenifigens DSM 19370]MBF5091047.1 hypothetical protein [Novosphingobium sp. NBM11]
MLTDSERFAFTARRIHGFASTGNAYDATQTDDRISSGDTLLILPEGVVGVAHCWPFAVTQMTGKLHGVQPKAHEALGDFAAAFNINTADIEAAIALAMALGFAIDPALAALIAPIA